MTALDILNGAFHNWTQQQASSTGDKDVDTIKAMVAYGKQLDQMGRSAGQSYYDIKTKSLVNGATMGGVTSTGENGDVFSGADLYGTLIPNGDGSKVPSVDQAVAQLRGSWSQLTDEQKQQVVAGLKQAGMSDENIAKAVQQLEGLSGQDGQQGGGLLETLAGVAGPLLGALGLGGDSEADSAVQEVVDGWNDMTPREKREAFEEHGDALKVALAKNVAGQWGDLSAREHQAHLNQPYASQLITELENEEWDLSGFDIDAGDEEPTVPNDPNVDEPAVDPITDDDMAADETSDNTGDAVTDPADDPGTADDAGTDDGTGDDAGEEVSMLTGDPHQYGYQSFGGGMTALS
jgi:predicted Fe-S protein YdhL (DUF1289 family)